MFLDMRPPILSIMISEGFVWSAQEETKSMVEKAVENVLELVGGLIFQEHLEYWITPKTQSLSRTHGVGNKQTVKNNNYITTLLWTFKSPTT